MSIINSTGLYGNSYLFEDVEQLKIDVTTLTTDHLSVVTNHDGRLDVLEGDDTTNKSNIVTLTTDNTTNKSNIATLTTDNTTNKTNISSHTTQIASL